MKEASKTLTLLSDAERALLAGRGIDIGCGDDPILPGFQPFDRAQGDAGRITACLDGLGAYNTVFSSHCLEHLADPAAALAEWWRLLRPGGILMLVVPDHDLYEQGYWPSLFNADHRCSFTLAAAGRAPTIHDLRALLEALPGARIEALRLQDEGYRRDRLSARRWPRAPARLANRLRLRLARHLPATLPVVDALYALLGLPIDQTCRGAAAQILAIARKAP